MPRLSIFLTALLAGSMAIPSPALGQRGRRGTPSPGAPRRGGPAARPRGVVARDIMNRLSLEQQDRIRTASRELREQLLEINRLRQIGSDSPDYRSAQELITTHAETALKLSADIYARVETYGIGTSIVDQQQALALVRNGLPPDERNVLIDAGFPEKDVADISAEIQLLGRTPMPKTRVADERNGLEAARRTDYIGKTLKIGGGALLIGVDTTSRFIPIVSTATAIEAVTSIASGMDMIADGLDTKPPSQ